MISSHLYAEEGMHEAVLRGYLLRQTAREERRGEPVSLLLLRVRNRLAADEQPRVLGAEVDQAPPQLLQWRRPVPHCPPLARGDHGEGVAEVLLREERGRGDN